MLKYTAEKSIVAEEIDEIKPKSSIFSIEETKKVVLLSDADEDFMQSHMIDNSLFYDLKTLALLGKEDKIKELLKKNSFDVRTIDEIYDYVTKKK